MSNYHKIKGSISIEHIDFHEPDTLEIRFCSGSTYHYPGCDKSHYHALKEAAMLPNKSAGSYFHKHIKAMKAVRID